ncbi:MAG TPA: glycosyltransferase family 39 protein [Lapillicoccus sp.]
MHSTTLSRSSAGGGFSQTPEASLTHPLPTAPSSAGRVHRLWRGSPADPAWARPALLGLLVATAAFYLYNLTASGWANSFYSAAAQAGSSNWAAFFFGSSDAANSITVDKPPASLWVMALSVKVFGLNSFAILFPQVVMGVASVGVLYATVRRHFGVRAGLVAAAVLALTPVAVLMFRFNNPDALLTFLMVLAAWATMKAIEKTSARWFMLVGVFLGFAFLTKTLQAFLVVPGFALAYLVAAKTSLPKRIWHVVLGGLAIILSAGWWVAIVELLPKSMRPYIGGSQTNSFLELTFGYNGFGRITGNETGSVGGGGGNWGATGLGRMFNAEIGGQISWLIPAALILLAAGLYFRGRRPRTDTRRAAYLVWGGWLVVTLLTFSLMAGIFHAYYTVALAPAVAALVGMGAAEAWEHRERPVGSIVLAVATAATAVWGFVLLSRSVEWNSWLRIVVLAVGFGAAFGFLVVSRVHRQAVPVIVGAALFASLLGPAAYSVQTVSAAHSGSIVDAGPSVAGAAGGPGGGMRGALGQAPGGVPGGTAQGGRGGMGGLLNASTPSTAVVSALSADAERYTWVAATIGSQNAAGLQLGTQLPVMAIGGFNGSDPSPTLAEFQADVQDGKIHYFLAGGGFGGQNGGSNVAAQISAWVQQSFTAVTIGGTTFYDLTQLASTGSGSTGTV